MKRPKVDAHLMVISLLLGALIGGCCLLLINQRYDPSEAAKAAREIKVVVEWPTATPTSSPTATPTQKPRTPVPTDVPIEMCSYLDENPDIATPGQKCKTDSPVRVIEPTPLIDCAVVYQGGECNWQPRKEGHHATPTPTPAISP